MGADAAGGCAVQMKCPDTAHADFRLARVKATSLPAEPYARNARSVRAYSTGFSSIVRCEASPKIASSDPRTPD